MAITRLCAFVYTKGNAQVTRELAMQKGAPGDDRAFRQASYSDTGWAGVSLTPLFTGNEFNKINAINTFRRRAGDWQKRSVNFGQLSDA